MAGSLHSEDLNSSSFVCVRVSCSALHISGVLADAVKPSVVLQVKGIRVERSEVGGGARGTVTMDYNIGTTPSQQGQTFR